MKRIEKYELIERYLIGTANPDERDEVESRIKTDSEFASEVELHRNMQNLIFDHSLLEIKNTLQEIRTRDQLSISRMKKFYRGLMFVGFCAFIISIFLFLLHRKDIAVRPASEAFEASEAFSVFIEQETAQEKQPDGVIMPKNEAYTRTSAPKWTKPDQKTPGVDKKEVPGKFEAVKPDVIRNDTDDTDLILPIPSQSGETENLSLTKVEAKPCNLIFEYLTEPSCNNNATGVIKIYGGSIAGGTPPYQVALNGDFSGLLAYYNLKPDLYSLEIRDSAGCIKKLDAILIDVINCFDKDYKFSPEKLEAWEVPVEPGKTGTLTIFIKAGQIVYQLMLDGTVAVTWNGNNTKYEALPLGLYPFVIRYNDGNFFEGTVTIVR